MIVSKLSFSEWIQSIEVTEPSAKNIETMLYLHGIDLEEEVTYLLKKEYEEYLNE